MAGRDVSRGIFVCKLLVFKTPVVKENSLEAKLSHWPASSHNSGLEEKIVQDTPVPSSF